MLSLFDEVRLRVSKRTSVEKKSALGQFFTPQAIAEFMANLFTATPNHWHGLDAGAGIGSLSGALINKWREQNNSATLRIDAYELDPEIQPELLENLTHYQTRSPFAFEIFNQDFIEEGVNKVQFGEQRYTHAILNPPYKKINSASRYRLLLRKLGIEVVNLYAGFVALALEMLEANGELVAIIPRSFCNGPYYLPFRKFILARATIKHIHLFHARNKAFQADQVLQENIILKLVRGQQHGCVTITTSTNDNFSDLTTHTYPFEQIVFSADGEQFIHIPTPQDEYLIERLFGIRHTLADLNIQVSTGPVVDFRLKEHLRNDPEENAVPLIYPHHLNNHGNVWPVSGSKKPNAILLNDITRKWFYPNGFYCAVRRFSSKEEKRRIIANVVDPNSFPDHTLLGFENHLNIFHENKRGLPKLLAQGLTIYLNSTPVDQFFRRFNGHTQVNATDLKLMKYPSRATLIALGNWSTQYAEITQVMIDEQIERLTT